MRFAEEKEDHYIIKQEKYEFDKTSTKRKINYNEYDSGSIKHMTNTELKETMKNLSWVV
jgi:hypothetical protein